MVQTWVAADVSGKALAAGSAKYRRLAPCRSTIRVLATAGQNRRGIQK